MINYINNIATDELVVYGVKNEANTHLDASSYTALQSLGLSD